MLRACLSALVLLSACSPEGEPAAKPAALEKNTNANAAATTSGAAGEDAAAVPFKNLGWDSDTRRFLLDGKPFTGVTTDHYKTSGKLKARYHLTDGLNDGLVEEWYENGQQKTKTSYVNGKHQGDNFYWNPDGTLQAHKVWKDDVLISEQH